MKLNAYQTLDSEDQRIFKLLIFVTLSNTVALLWDLFGLKVAVTPWYLFFKALFLVLPFPYLLSDFGMSKGLKYALLSSFFYFYCFYHVVWVDFSYYTAFIQFFFGTVFFITFPVRDFILTHGTGIILYGASLTLLRLNLSPEDYAQKLQLMNGAVIPIIGISILFYFSIRRREQADLAKAVFFQQIGTNVGFILHEIKQPIKKIQNEVEGKNLEELNELLETANLMWPTRSSKSRIQINEFNFKKLVEEVLKQYEEFTELIRVTIEIKNCDHTISVNRAFFKIVLKNLIKNALEESLDNGLDNTLTIEMKDLKTIQISNTTKKKGSTLANLYEAGYSTKKGIGNKGLGLFIAKQLCQKMDTKISLEHDHHLFRATLSL